MFRSYDYISKLLNKNIKQANKIKLTTIVKYLSSLIVVIVGSIILLKIAADPNLLNLEPTYGDLQTNNAVRAGSYLLIFILVLGLLIFWFRTSRHFKRQYKDIIVKEMVKQLIETYQLSDDDTDAELKWNYSGRGRMPNNGIYKSGLFIMDRIDKAFGSDLIWGKLGFTKYFLSALTLYEERTVEGNSQNRKQYKKLKKRFQGVLFLADFNKSFKGHTLLQDKRVKSYQHFKRYIRMLFYKSGRRKLNRIKLENPTFNRLFKTKTTHEIEARYILTPNFIEKIIAFRKKRRIPIDIAFRQNFISIACFSKKSFFKPSIFRRMKHGQVKDVYNDLCFFLSIIEELELNTRIWSK